MTRTPLIAANWKMNLPPKDFAASRAYASVPGVDVVVFPMFPDIDVCREASLTVGGQCGRAEAPGARTGDVSMESLATHGCTSVLCGHSERRRNHGETDADVSAQVTAARAVGLMPVVCLGETREERDRGETHVVIERQMRAITLPAVLAYEPVWAIGSGGTPATPEGAQEVHAFIRSLLAAGERETTRILYGGSVKPETAAGFLAQPDIDGLLVGAASLEPSSFGAIVRAACGD